MPAIVFELWSGARIGQPRGHGLPRRPAHRDGRRLRLRTRV